MPFDSTNEEKDAGDEALAKRRPKQSRFLQQFQNAQNLRLKQQSKEARSKHSYWNTN